MPPPAFSPALFPLRSGALAAAALAPPPAAPALGGVAVPSTGASPAAGPVPDVRAGAVAARPGVGGGVVSAESTCPCHRKCLWQRKAPQRATTAIASALTVPSLELRPRLAAFLLVTIRGMAALSLWLKDSLDAADPCRGGFLLLDAEVSEDAGVFHMRPRADFL